MSRHFDGLETRSAEAREADIAKALPGQIAKARALPGNAARLAETDPAGVTTRGDLARLPVLRKDALLSAQAGAPPLGGLSGPATDFSWVFQSPGPIYEPGQRDGDFWRFGRALHAAGIGAGDIMQNCFSYHFTPAGLMFETGAAAVGATVFPAGTGNTALQARAAAEIGVTAYGGTPDYLAAILEQADADGLSLKIARAQVSGGALFPAMREAYADRGIACLQCYGTADLGLIAYESPAMEGMIVDEGVIVEIVRPGTGDPVPDGEVGEVVVTLLNSNYPLIRFATGDMSAVLAGKSPCGRTNMRIKGWMGRADQTTKVKGMFVRPEQVAEFVAKNDGVRKARVIVTRGEGTDEMRIEVEAEGADAGDLAGSARAIMKLGAEVVTVAPGSLPNDGKVIDDRRSYD